jgi:hypothetical protein
VRGKGEAGSQETRDWKRGADFFVEERVPGDSGKPQIGELASAAFLNLRESLPDS